MFANKEISVKVCGPTRSESTSHLLVWVYRERCVNIWYLRVLYTVFVLIFHHKNFSSSTITPCHVLIGVKLNHCTCMLRTCKLWLNENKNEAEISTWAFPLDSPRKDQGPGICFGAGSPSINPIIISLS